MFRWGRAAIAYTLMAAAAVAIGAWLGRGSLAQHPGPWLTLSPVQAHGYSLALGVVFAALVVVTTRISVSSAGWAKTLHRDLRPLTLQLDATSIVVVAIFSAVGEELLFRGLLQHYTGLVVQALLFGVVHAQLPGQSRWVWVSWATLVGAALGALFQLTGSLLGPIAAHALINGVNLFYLRSHDPMPAPRALGGLLNQAGRPLPAGRRA